MKSRDVAAIIAALGFSLLSLVPKAAQAAVEPYLSVRTGMRCSQCHVNRTGGGGRNAFGTMYGQTRLSMGKSSFRNRALNDYIAVGGNFRLLSSGTVSKTEPRTSIKEKVNIQFEARVVPNILAFYIDQTVGPNAASMREGFALVEQLPFNGYVKAGKFLLPYGLRLLDDAEYIRQSTGFNYNTPDQGVEVGVEPGPLSLFLAVSNGRQGAEENNSGKQYTATGVLTFPRFRIGGSASRNSGPGSRREVVGAFGGFNLGRFAFLGEFDFITDSPDTGAEREQFAGFIEGDFLAVPGLNLKVTYGFLDPNADIGENAQFRMRFGLEAFPIQFFQVSGFYTLLQDIPQATSDLDRISVELHVYF